MFYESWGYEEIGQSQSPPASPVLAVMATPSADPRGRRRGMNRSVIGGAVAREYVEGSGVVHRSL